MSEHLHRDIHYTVMRDTTILGCAWHASANEFITCAHVASSASSKYLLQNSFNNSRCEECSLCRTTGTENPFRDATTLMPVPTSLNLTLGSGVGIAEPYIGQLFTVFGRPPGKMTMGAFARYSVTNRLPIGWHQVEIADSGKSELREGFSGAPAWDHVLQCVIGIVVGIDPQRKEEVAYIIPPSVLKDQVGLSAEQRYPTFDGNFHKHLSVNKPSQPHCLHVISFLSSAISTTEDPVQRYWIYHSIAEFSNEATARLTLEKAQLNEIDEFALLGIQEALAKFPKL